MAWKDPLWQYKDADTKPSIDLNTLDLGDFEYSSEPDETIIPDVQRDDNHFSVESSAVIATIQTINPHPITRAFISYITRREVVNYRSLGHLG